MNVHVHWILKRLENKLGVEFICRLCARQVVVSRGDGGAVVVLKMGRGVAFSLGGEKFCLIRSRRTCSIYALSTFYCYLVFLRHVDPFGLTWLDLTCNEDVVDAIERHCTVA